MRELRVLTVPSMAATDPLTNIGNRRSFEEAIARAHARSGRDQSPYGVLMADVDNFKAYNDRYGHQAGDEVLVRIAGLMRDTIRAGDQVFRYGGEELVVVCPTDTVDALAVFGERLRAAVEGLAVEHPDNRPVGCVTCSLGGFLYRPTGSGSRARGEWNEGEQYLPSRFRQHGRGTAGCPGRAIPPGGGERWPRACEDGRERRAPYAHRRRRITLLLRARQKAVRVFRGGPDGGGPGDGEDRVAGLEFGGYGREGMVRARRRVAEGLQGRSEARSLLARCRPRWPRAEGADRPASG